MGEYMTLASGEYVKLGTCEDLFYISLDRLRREVQAGARECIGSLPPADYLDPAGGWRYRFPWPDEDGMGDDHNRAMIVTTPAAWFPEREHDTITRTVKPISQRPYGGGYLVNIETPCPLSGEPMQCSTVPQIVEIYEQKQVEGLVWLIARCPYCGALWRVPPQEGRELWEHMLANQDAHDDWMFRVAQLIAAGYEVQP